VFPGGKGRLANANDMLYSFKRMMDPSVQSPVASFFADKVIGWQEYSAAFEKLGRRTTTMVCRVSRSIRTTL
jgi:hypothetical protein